MSARTTDSLRAKPFFCPTVLCVHRSVLCLRCDVMSAFCWFVQGHVLCKCHFTFPLSGRNKCYVFYRHFYSLSVSHGNSATYMCRFLLKSQWLSTSLQRTKLCLRAILLTMHTGYPHLGGFGWWRLSLWSSVWLLCHLLPRTLDFFWRKTDYLFYYNRCQYYCQLVIIFQHTRSDTRTNNHAAVVGWNDAVQTTIPHSLLAYFNIMIVYCSAILWYFDAVG